MKRQVSIQDAQSNLDELVMSAHAGEDIVLTKSGSPVARVVPLNREPRSSVFGVIAGELPEMTEEQWDESDRAVAELFSR